VLPASETSEAAAGHGGAAPLPDPGHADERNAMTQRPVSADERGNQRDSPSTVSANCAIDSAD